MKQAFVDLWRATIEWRNRVAFGAGIGEGAQSAESARAGLYRGLSGALAIAGTRGHAAISRVSSKNAEDRRLLGEQSRDRDPALLKAVVRGYRWFRELASGAAADTRAIARRELYTTISMGRIELPLLWTAQKQAIGIS